MILGELTDSEIKYVYDRVAGKFVFPPIYNEYKKLFNDEVNRSFPVKTDFDALKDTSVYERYQLNVAQFSAAKSMAENKLLQGQLFNEDKVLKGFSEFKADAKKVTDIVQETWLKTEYESARKCAVQGELFTRMRADADIYPYWRYLRTISLNPRDEHLKLVGLVFRIGDPYGDRIFPPDGWNCGCGSEMLDDQDIDKEGLSILTESESAKFLDSDVDPQFRFNPADQGILPKDGSYFDVMKNANTGNYKTFGLDSADKLGGDTKLTGLAAKGVHYLLETVESWKQKYGTNQAGEIIFQNKELMSNVRFNNNSFNHIRVHSTGFENIPEAIMSPSEVWATWEDTDSQQTVLRNYILFGRVSYVVQTKAGVIVDAFSVSNTAANKYRKGVIL